MRKGGTAKTLRALIIWLIILTFAVTGMILAKDKKETYTELHRRVKFIETLMGIK